MFESRSVSMTCPEHFRASPRVAALTLMAVTLLALLFAACLTARTARADSPLIPVSGAGLEVELWSDPPAGTVVHPGTAARLQFRASEDCYVALIAVETDGRMRLLYPGFYDDGWVRGGHTYGAPRPGDSFDLVLGGAPGMEYVYAVASLSPLRPRYPEWLLTGHVLPPDTWDADEEDDPYDTGWIVGDPFYQVRGLCRRLVADPEAYDTYCTAYVYFHVGRRVEYPRYLCADCHTSTWVDPYGPRCAAVRLSIGRIRCSGWIDFRRVFDPCYRYEIWTGWRPHGWQGRRWNGPGGRWVWSSADGRREIHRQFGDALGRKPGDSEDLRVPDNMRGHVPPGSGERRVESPNQSRREERNAWHRALEDRLDRAVEEQPPRPERGNEPGRSGVERDNGHDRPKAEPSGKDGGRSDSGKGDRVERKADSGTEKPFHRFR